MSKRDLPVSSPVVDIMHDTVTSACISLFAGYQSPVTNSEDLKAEALNAQHQMFAMIGFGGPVVRGMMGIGGPLPFFERAHPSFVEGGAPLSRSDLCDWTGELANQLLGRITNIMSGHRVPISGGTPSIITGDLMDLVRPRIGFKHFVFRQGADAFSVWMHVEQHGEAAPLAELELQPSQPEGELLLF